MNTQGIETLFIGMIVSTLMMALFIRSGSLVLDYFKLPAPPKIKRPGPPTAPAGAVSRRRKIEMRPNIVCLLPMHQPGRPEAPMA